ncbi:hypothetical protein P154DRAFT_526276 [Amniculicola lignicola CBS 123094]|uniref:Uncharacterized protein n=1 Tax=Amniculicola lignicola CBS 123094 TaxID=1392246 RepID=A0A6A5W3H3_9PLEO|nr:hypothetical protein P154DRAFT_526276 [Amniculicola lignicola CBS 123094]
MDEKTVTQQSEPLLPPFEKRPIPPRAHTSVHPLAIPNGEIAPQPLVDSPTDRNSPIGPLDSLPTISGQGTEVFLVEEEGIDKFLQQDLDLSRLNRIHGHLWMAGRPMRARPLHRYRMLGFDLLWTQQMDLHLLKFSNRLMLKPLPEYLLCYDFWTTHICTDQDLYKSAAGFLLSYIWLIVSPLDLKVAHDNHLLPSFVTWHWWKQFVTEFVKCIDPNALDQVNKRFHFGDLRLGRINSIYRTRFMHTHFVRGYLYGYNRYVVFFQRNFSWILIVFVFFSLVLSAMQVGAGVAPLSTNDTFRRASYGFVVFSMVAVAAVLGFIGFMFSLIFLINMVLAISHDNDTRRKREDLAVRRVKKDA